jgi:hypothetical protein
VAVRRLETPDDLGTTLGGEFTVHQWLAPPMLAEPALRAAVMQLFGALDDIDPEDAGAVAAHLDASAGSLAQIRALRLQLVAIRGSGLTRFIIAQSTCLFRIEDRDVHLLGADCAAAAQEVIVGGPFRWWGAPGLVARAHEDGVPWCPRCVEVAAAAET